MLHSAVQYAVDVRTLPVPQHRLSTIDTQQNHRQSRSGTPLRLLLIGRLGWASYHSSRGNVTPYIPSDSITKSRGERRSGMFSLRRKPLDSAWPSCSGTSIVKIRYVRRCEEPLYAIAWFLATAKYVPAPGVSESSRRRQELSMCFSAVFCHVCMRLLLDQEHVRWQQHKKYRWVNANERLPGKLTAENVTA